MTYPQTIEYLYQTLPMFSHVGSAAFKKDLTNTLLLCEHLKHPQHTFKSIHIAGTNGKGSVSHMLASIFQTAGYKTGLYTSPHLYDFRERIRINGMLAEEDFVVDFVDRMKPAIEQVQPSFFEITVAMAFEYFASGKVDIAIIETGLGGRLDSTNVITPELSVITNIGWDHMNLLGDTLPAIAFEKAGIIKPRIPVAIGERNPETDPVFEQQAQLKQSPVYFAQDLFSVISTNLKTTSMEVQVKNNSNNEVSSYECGLAGIYQAKNIITVLQAIEVVKSKWNITEQNIHRGIKEVTLLTGLQGRWEVICDHPWVILEVAHNKEGIQQMIRHLQHLNYESLHMIVGVVKDKDVNAILELLPKEAHFYFTQSHIPRAMPAADLHHAASLHSLKGTVHEDVNEALNAAKKRAGRNDVIIVCGSIFLVAEVQRS